MKIVKFEELDCWKEGRKLALAIYRYVNKGSFSKDIRLSGQITGASISVMNNIAEGFDSGSGTEFARFLYYARRSCSEVQNCLYIALDQKYINHDEFDDTYKQCEKVRQIIDGMIRHLKNRRKQSSTG